METNPCGLLILILLPVVMITLGLIYIFNKDRAWRIAEKILRSVKPQRTPEWERSATINGMILLVTGVVIAAFLISLLTQ